MTPSRRHFGSVRRLPSGYYQASYWNDRRRHVASTTFQTKADANACLDAVSASIGRNDWVDPELGRISFGRYAELWLAQRHRHPGPHQGVLRLAHHQPPQPRLRTAGAGQDHTGPRARLVRGPRRPTPGVARSAYRLLKAIFNTAISDDLMLKNPCRVKGGGTDKALDRRSRISTR